jgi:hypothetical protein
VDALLELALVDPAVLDVVKVEGRLQCVHFEHQQSQPPDVALERVEVLCLGLLGRVAAQNQRIDETRF